MSAVPAWVSGLPEGRRCGAERVAWNDWELQVNAYCTSLQSTGPRRTQAEWRAKWPLEYGKPPIVGSTPVGFTLGELILVDAFRTAGWTAFWTDAFGSAPEWTLPWRIPQGPEEDHFDRIRELLQEVRVAANNAEVDYPVRHRKLAKPWDVVAWRRGAIRIVEFKQPGEDFKESQRRFAWGSGLLGLDPKLFAVVFGVIAFPRSVTGTVD
jgi:hypothetical protein